MAIDDPVERYAALHDVPPASRVRGARRRRRRRVAAVCALVVVVPLGGVAIAAQTGAWDRAEHGRADWFDDDGDGRADRVIVEGTDATAGLGCSLLGFSPSRASAVIDGRGERARWAVVQVTKDANGHVTGGERAQLLNHPPVDDRGVVALVERYPAGLLVLVEVGGGAGSVPIPPNRCAG